MAVMAGDDTVDVLVVGAGISGLSAAVAAQRAGRSVVVIERGTEPGGVVRSRVQDGVLVESGPHAFLANAECDALIASLALHEERCMAQPAARNRYIVRNGIPHAVPTSPPAFVRSPLLSMTGKLRALAEACVRPRAEHAEESLAACVSRRFGREVLDHIVDPLVSGICAGDPSRLSANHTLAVVAQYERAHGSVIRGAFANRPRTSRRTPLARPQLTSFRSGLQRLPLSLATALGTSMRYEHEAHAVRRVDDGWSVSGVSQGYPFAWRARRVIVAIPAHALPAIAWDSTLAPLVGDIASVSYVPIATVTLSYARPQVSHALDGFGALVPHAEQRATLGILFASSMFAGRTDGDRVVLTAFLGGARHPAFTDHDAAIRAAHCDVSAILGITGAPHTAHATLFSRGIPQYELGHDGIVDAVARVSERYPMLQFIGSYVNGLSVGDCIRNGLAAGAV